MSAQGICEYDTGSMFGCRPACDEPATVTVGWRTPCYGTFTARLCRRHVRSMSGRVYPSTLEVTG